MEINFEVEEIKETIWNCDNDKAPGPDGFTFEFIKRYWSLMQEDIMKFIDNLKLVGILLEGVSVL